MVLNVEAPEGWTCPEESVTNYEINEFLEEDGAQYLNTSLFKYAFDSGDYNNSIITINEVVKTNDTKSVTYCDFKSSVFSGVTIWNNI